MISNDEIFGVFVDSNLSGAFHIKHLTKIDIKYLVLIKIIKQFL